MRRILDIAGKDLLQLLRDRKTFLFLLIMPILFTFLFGFAFGGFSKGVDPRLPVGYIDEDDTWLSRDLHGAAGELGGDPAGGVQLAQSECRAGSPGSG